MSDKVFGYGGRLHRYFIMRRLRKRWLAPKPPREDSATCGESTGVRGYVEPL